MLILTRRVGETLFAGDDVTVTVLGVKGNQVRLGIAAPSDVEVHREEIYYRIHPERTPADKRKWMGLSDEPGDGNGSTVGVPDSR